MSIKTLVVDDEKALLEQAEKFIGELDRGIKVHTAISVDDALEMLDEQDFDVIVSDYHIPGMDGIEFLKILREEREDDIPFIMLTGKGKEEVAMKALNLGANRYLQKVGKPKPWYDILAQAIEQEIKQFKAEKRILESEERYRKLFESAQDGMLIIDAETGIIQNANTRLQEISGYPKEEFIGKRLWDLDTFKNIVDRKKKFQQFCEEGSIREEDQQVKTKDGGKIPVEFVSNTYKAGGKKIVQCNIREISERKKAKEALKESKEKFKKLFDASPDLTYFLDKNGIIQEVNQAGMDLLGYEREELIGKHFSELPFLPPETKEKIAEKVKKRLRGEEISPYLIEAKTKNGKQLFAEVNSALIKEDGEPVGSIGIIRDTTERKKAKEKLEKSEERYRRLFESAKNGILILDGETGKIENANSYLEDFLGYSKEELVGKEIWKIDTFLNIVGTREAFEELVEEENIYYEDIHLETKEGKGVPVEIEINTYHAGGKEVVQCKIIDISAKKSRQSLQEAVMRFRKLSEASPNAIILVNKDTGVIKDVNEVAEELLDMERKDIIGKDYLDLHPEEGKEEIRGIVSQPEEEESRTSKEVQIKDSDDNKIPVKMRTSSLVLGDEEIMYFVLNDISKRKEAEEREEFLHSLLRHDLRNKIHISKGNLDLLKESGLPEEKKEFLDDALESYEEGMDIIEKVRDLKKLGKDEVKEVSIGEGILRRSVDQYRSEAESKGMEIELNMNDVSAKVNGGELLPEVFSNLISNSIKHSYGDKILVSVEEDEGEVICRVEDDGDGIPQEKKDEIFEKGFTTVNSSSGLGLYLVKDIVEHYGGSVEVKDSELGGARFDVYLQKV